ncbi:MAG TPA: orotidine-5'-phosphate decarboxylase [bacterium]|nr:orotidine-5'-phosphate decarboxylase [bacterium]
MEKGKVFIALDVADRREALAIVAELKGLGAGWKIGKQLFTQEGPALVKEIVAMGEDVFLDLKYHDIPHTVAMAGVAAAKLGVKMFNVHAAGGRMMMAETRKALDTLPDRPLVLAVTVLTSLSAEDLAEVGYHASPAQQVARFAKLAEEAGMDGVVASPLEIEIIRSVTRPSFKILTPGIRPAGGSQDDQKRIATPAAAIAAGADYLVIGRPVTQAVDRKKAFLDILEEIKNG